MFPSVSFSSLLLLLISPALFQAHFEWSMMLLQIKKQKYCQIFLEKGHQTKFFSPKIVLIDAKGLESSSQLLHDRQIQGRLS
jgi:hypothetical protein